ncbi:MAG TPA: hypothetical protein VH879_03165 [Gemmatimonadales bacterium]|jgi:hypothetical protein
MRLPIRGFGARPTEAEIAVRTLTGMERLRRGAIVPAMGLGLAVLVLPIPIVHLAVPPVALLGGIVLGVRRALQREIFERARGACPFCGNEQTLGLNGAVYRLPRDFKCRACGRLLTLEAA